MTFTSLDKQASDMVTNSEMLVINYLLKNTDCVKYTSAKTYKLDIRLNKAIVSWYTHID